MSNSMIIVRYEERWIVHGRTQIKKEVKAIEARKYLEWLDNMENAEIKFLDLSFTFKIMKKKKY